MNKIKKIQQKLDEAEVYLNQGLLLEAKEIYLKIAEQLKGEGVDRSIRELLGYIDEKMDRLEDEIEAHAGAKVMPEVSASQQDRIMDSFSCSPLAGEEENRFRGAVALVEFGQYDRAIAELEPFLASGAFKVRAAEQILQCHVEASRVDHAVASYREWESRRIFLLSELERIRLFLLKRYFFKKGMKKLCFDE